MHSADRPDRYAVIGHPVAHSKSPHIHARFAELTGQHLVYERVLAPLDGFATTVRHFAAAGGRGCNITVPFKFEAHDLAVQRSERATLAQAVNTLRFDAEGWFGDNTDGAGLVHDLQHNAGLDLAGRDLLLLGAGGASAGVLGPLLAARPRRLVVANRSLDKAQALVARHAAWANAHGVALSAAGLDDCGTGYAVVLNGTAASLQGAGSPVPAAVLGPGALALDMMYGPAAEPFLQWAREHGAAARDGLGMLVEQAAEAFQVWRGVRPPTAEVLRELRAGLTG
jgi:shikimate dehydrogenase